MIAADGRHHQDGVRFVSVERAMRHIGDREVLDDLPAFEREVSNAIELVRRLAPPPGPPPPPPPPPPNKEDPPPPSHPPTPPPCRGHRSTPATPQPPTP